MKKQKKQQQQPNSIEYVKQVSLTVSPKVLSKIHKSNSRKRKEDINLVYEIIIMTVATIGFIAGFLWILLGDK